MTEPIRTVRSADEAPSNQRLVQALREVSAGADRRDSYQALLPGPVLVPTARREPAPADPPALLAIQVPTAGPQLLGFTSVQMLRAWSKDVQAFTVMSGTELARQARVARAEGVLLDAGSDHEMHLDPFELDQLAEGLVPVRPGEVRGQVTRAARRVRPTASRWPPAAEAVVRATAGRDEVQHAYLFDIAYHDGEFHPAVGLRFHPGSSPEEIDEIMADLARELQQHLPIRVQVDVVVLDDSLDEAVHDIVSPLP